VREKLASLRVFTSFRVSPSFREFSRVFASFDASFASFYEFSDSSSCEGKTREFTSFYEFTSFTSFYEFSDSSCEGKTREFTSFSSFRELFDFFKKFVSAFRSTKKNLPRYRNTLCNRSL
jgi:hypothetical protein